MEKNSSHNLSMALRHILQQFMDSMNEHKQKNTNMVLPHDGYSQKLSWYFECDKCHYKAFYSQEMDAHRILCYSTLNHQDLANLNQFQQNSERASSGSGELMADGDVDAMDVASQRQNTMTNSMSGYNMRGQPTGGTSTDAGVQSPPAPKTTAKTRRRRRPKAANQETQPNVGNEVVMDSGTTFAQDAQQGEFSEKMEINAPKEEQPWEFEQIIVSADTDGATQSGTTIKRKRKAAGVGDAGSTSPMCDELYGGSHDTPTSLNRKPLHPGLNENNVKEPITKGSPYKGSVVRRVSRYDHSRCSNKCAHNVSLDTQDRLLQFFTALNEVERFEYYSKTVITKAPNKSSKSYKGKKQAACEYYVSVGGELVRVCKDFYVSTHGISSARLEVYLNQCDKGSLQAKPRPRRTSAGVKSPSLTDVADANNTAAAVDAVKWL